MGQWMIVGDVPKHGFTDCLIYVVGTKERGEEVLNRMLTNPDNNDLLVMKDHVNLHLKEETDKSRCWWDDPFLAN